MVGGKVNEGFFFNYGGRFFFFCILAKVGFRLVEFGSFRRGFPRVETEINVNLRGGLTYLRWYLRQQEVQLSSLPVLCFSVELQ